MSSPIWITAAGSIGTIPENTDYQYQFSAAPVGETLTYKVIAGSLPAGLTLSSSGLLYGTPQAVASITTYTFTIRVTNVTKIADRTFNLTIGGLIAPIISPDSGSLGSFFDGQYYDRQLISIEPTGSLVPTFSLVKGALPYGLTLTSSGRLYGYLSPVQNTQSDATAGFDATYFDKYPFEFYNVNISRNYQFSVKVDDGAKIDINDFTMYVYARSGLTADNYISPTDPSRSADSNIISADSTLITADLDTVYNPILLSDAGELASVRQNTIFQYQLLAKDFNDDILTYNITSGSLPTGLSLNTESGWITGSVPYGPLGSVVYDFSLNVSKVVNGTTYYSETKDFSLKISGQIKNIVNWITPSNLGTIYNGDISSLYISASTPSNRELKYKLIDSSVGGMPIGLELLSDGLISGRTSFQVDGNSVDYTFTVAAYDIDNLVYDEKTFTITVVKRDLQPFENLYIQLLPNRTQRQYYDSIVANSDIFPDDYIYRFTDPWFGKNSKRRCLLMTGLNPLEASDYIAAMELNHYWKNIGFGEVKTAEALDDNFNVIYEVVYIELLDKSVNANGQGPNVAITLPPNDVNISTAYPNSFTNMAQRIQNGVGYENRSILPRWMTSRQPNGTVLGFTRALILCYTKPGKSAEIAYRVQQVQDLFKLIDFTVDRYEWDNVLSTNWIKTPVDGTGNITANINSSNVSGSGTTFSSELSSNTSIYVSNVIIGNVNTIYSDNLLGLYADASGTISDSPFTYNHTFMLNVYTVGSGVITTSNTSNIVIGSNTTVVGTGNISGVTGNATIVGNNTAFNSELKIGKVLYVNNAPIGTIGSITGPTYLTLETPLTSNVNTQPFTYTGNLTAFTSLHLGDSIVSNGSVIGTVKSITDDFALVLTANATATLSNVTYSYTTRDLYTVPGDGDKYLKFPHIRVITSEFTTPEY